MTLTSLTSNAPWLRTMPPDWRVDRLKDIVPRILGGGTPSSSDPDCWEDGDIVWVTPTDFSRSEDRAEIFNSERKITCKGLNSSAATLLPKGTVIMASRATIGTVRLAGTELATNQGFISFVCDEKRLHRRFLYYVISSILGQYFAEIAPGTTFQEISRGKARLEPISFPLLPEQHRIAAYLDASCAAIDAAVAAKRRQIETLGALHKTIIHNVITRGLNAEFDEPRVGWIEKTPNNWKKVKMFRICQKISSGGTPSTSNLDYYGGNIPWVQTGDLNDGYVEVIEKTITQLGLEKSAARIYPEGTLLMAMYGATIGKLGILKNPSATNQACCAMKFRNDVDNRFIFYLLRDLRPTFIAMSYGGGQPNISQETIKQLYFFLPPFHEQQKISQYLDNRTSAIETIKAGIESQIATLTAYRKSLIHECVTGQRRITDADVAQAHRGRDAK